MGFVENSDFSQAAALSIILIFFPDDGFGNHTDCLETVFQKEYSGVLGLEQFSR